MQTRAREPRSQREIGNIDGDKSNAHLVENVKEVLQSLEAILGLVAGQGTVGHFRIATRGFDRNKCGSAWRIRPERAAVVGGCLSSTKHWLLTLGHCVVSVFSFSLAGLYQCALE